VTLRESRDPHTGILYDPALVGEPRAELFDPAYWDARGRLQGRGGGRGSVCFLEHDGRAWVLRRYKRGGLVGRWIDERFLYTGAARTRSFRELRLLHELHARGLPVPRPVAAHFHRRGLAYRADLITERLAAEPLSQWLARGPLPEATWRAVGAMVARFHAAGVWHADLTAHNILVDEHGAPWLLDFDRGRLRAAGRWRERNLARLSRSLRKIRPRVAAASVGEAQWAWLRAGYASAAAHA
jgi:3-deoxy-D-manno-octulosonic acid kinase